MPKFIKVTDHDNRPLYINIDHVETVFEAQDVEAGPYTRITFPGNAEDAFVGCKESVAEVMGLIRDADASPSS